MYKDKIMQLINNENYYTISNYVLKCSKDLKLDSNSLILLIYFLNQKNNDIFNYVKIKDDLNFNEQELMEAIVTLKQKKILSIKMEKNESGILEEVVDISSFYDIAFSKLTEEEVSNNKNENLYDTFEKEFGRTLSPMEYEIINSWVDTGIDKSLILSALKEATYNGVSNLRYIDKILFEWGKKGFKKAADIDEKKQNEQEEKEESYYEYDWLNE